MQEQRSPVQVRDQLFTRRGLSVRGWALENKVSVFQTYQVLNGKSKALRGQAHRIAVLLGLKAGEVPASSHEA